MKQIIALFLLFLLNFSCTKDEVVDSSDMFDISGRYGEFKIDTVYAIQDTFIFGDYSNTKNSFYLNIGQKDVFSSLVYIKFNYLPVDTIRLDSVTVQFRTAHWFGSDLENQIDVDVYVVDEDWLESLNLDNDWHDRSTKGQFISRVSFSTVDSSTTDIDIPGEIAASWQSDSSNFGIVLIPAETENGMLSLYSLENDENYPLFIFNMLNDSSFVKDTIAVGIDASVFEFNTLIQPNYYSDQQNLGHTVVSSGTISRALYKFDFSGIPEAAIIQSAELKASYSIDQQLNNPNKSDVFKLRRVVDAESLLTHLTVDSSFYSSLSYDITIESTDDGLSLSNSNEIKFGKYILQNVLNEKDINPWFLIEYEDQAEMFSMVSLEGITEEKPYVIIRYFDANRIGY